MYVLVVEDHEDTCATLAKLLTRWGYDVATAGSVKSAMSFFDNFRFDVLLSDIGLPDGDGLEVVRAAKERRAARMAVALTAHGNAEDRALGLGAGFDHYLSKPFEPECLRSVLATAEAGS